MARAATIAWRAMLALFAVFVVLAVLRLTFLGGLISNDMVWLPLVAAILLLMVMAAIDTVSTWWWVHQARLRSLCVGFSFKLFDWRLGDESHLRRPGGHLLAIGPFRLAWRTAPTPDHVTITIQAGELVGRAEVTHVERVAAQ